MSKGGLPRLTTIRIRANVNCADHPPRGETLHPVARNKTDVSALAQTEKLLPQPQVAFTAGFLNLNPAPSSVST